MTIARFDGTADLQPAARVEREQPMATSLPDHDRTTDSPAERGRDPNQFTAIGEPVFDQEEDRVLGVHPAPNRPARRLPNQHDLNDIDDEELYRRPAADTSLWDE